MKSVPFVRHAPRTVAEAAAMLAEFGPKDGRVLAGGQSLVPIMAFRMARPAHLVDINGVAELARHVAGRRYRFRSAPLSATRRSIVRSSKGKWAGCSPPSCATSRIIRSARAARSAAASRMPIPRRNGAWWRRRSRRRWWRRSARGQRVIAADDFFEGIMTTALAEDETPHRGSPAGHFRSDPLRLL